MARGQGQGEGLEAQEQGQGLEVQGQGLVRSINIT